MIAWLFGKKEAVGKDKDDDFVSLSSHELRAPLSIIKWYTEMLLDEDAGPLTEDQRKYLTVIETSNQRAIDLVRSLLNVSRLDLGTFRISPKESRVEKIIDQAVSSLISFASQRGITITKKVEENLPSIVLDEQIIAFMLKQVISNAIIFSQEGKEVVVGAKLVQGGLVEAGLLLPEKSILVTITDSGIGIPENEHDKIFTKMYKASNVTDTTSTGSGLGLYMVKKLSSFFNAKVWFTSSSGKGTSLYLAIPCTGMKAKEGKTTLD